MPMLEHFEQVDLSVASKSKQMCCLTLVFIVSSISSLKMGQSHTVWSVAVSLVAIQLGISTLWSSK